MSLTKDDKEWIKDAIITGLDGSLKPVIIEMREGFKTINDRITNLVEKNDLKE